MAYESIFWKTQIKRDVDYILKKLNVKINKIADRELDRIFSRVEIKLFTIAYSLRKLMDTYKFPDNLVAYKVNVSRFPRNYKKHIRPYSSFIDCYILKKPEKRKIKLRELCNQFIHAYFFQLSINSKNNIGVVFFVSNRDKEKCLYSVNIKYFLRQIKIISRKCPCSIVHMYDEEENRWRTIAK